MAQPCNGRLFSLKEEGNSDTCSHVGEPWRHCTMWNKPNTKGQTLCFSLYEVPIIVKFIETEGGLEIIGAGGRGRWGVIGYSVSVQGHEKSSGMDSGGSCTPFWMCLMLLNYILKMVKMGQFYVKYILP